MKLCSTFAMIIDQNTPDVASVSGRLSAWEEHGIDLSAEASDGLSSSEDDGLGSMESQHAEFAAVSHKRRRSNTTCWGQLLGAAGVHQTAEHSAAFRNHFCALCQSRGVTTPATRVRVVMDAETRCGNVRTVGVWNYKSRLGWPPHRVVNQTAGSAGPRLVVLREETEEELTLKGLLPLPCGRDESVVFRVGRTLNPITLPPLRLPSPPAAAPSPPSPSQSPPPPFEAAFWEGFDDRVDCALSQAGWGAVVA